MSKFQRGDKVEIHHPQWMGYTGVVNAKAYWKDTYDVFIYPGKIYRIFHSKYLTPPEKTDLVS